VDVEPAGEVRVARTRLCERNGDGTFSWDRDRSFSDNGVERLAPGVTTPSRFNNFTRTAGSVYLRHGGSTDAVLVTHSNLANLGLVDFQKLTALPSGGILLLGEVPYGAADQGPCARFGAKYAILDSQVTPVIDIRLDVTGR
jgi:hypothetical protein